MRFMKMFGLATTAVMVAMAFAGTTSGLASKPTQLCNVQHSGGGETCSSPAINVHIVNVDAIVILSDILDILCLHVLAAGEAGALAAPGVRQIIIPTELLFSNCGSTAAHSTCAFTVNELPVFKLLRVALNLGNITTSKGRVGVKCTIAGIFKMDCELGPEESFEAPTTGALHTAVTGHGMITMVKAFALTPKGGSLCPSKLTLDALLEPLSHLFIAS